MSPSAPKLRPLAFSLLALALLIGRLALDLHPYEHLLDAGGETEICHACAAAGATALPAGACPPFAAPPPASCRNSGARDGAVALRPWTRPPYRGPPALV